MKLTGGYLLHRLDGIRTGFMAHTSALEQPVSPADMAAMNAVQETPWRINTWLLDVMTEAWAKGLRLGGLEVGEPLSLPARVADATWSGLTDAGRAEHVTKLRSIHQQNASITGRSQLVLDCLSVATELRERAAIYFPHSKDFRHRIYCAATRGPNPQGSDVSKSLLMFAEGRPLGPDGLGWLCVRAADCWGRGGGTVDISKTTLEERIAWTLSRKSLIQTAQADPLSSMWWTKADEPWSFLATCNELELVLSGSSPEAFVSHLPIPMDGSCNGLQHLAAMGLDPIGARATNLTAEPVMQDIYEEVAKQVRLQVEQDHLDGVPGATAWLGSISRKTVKRAVMTTPYGVTDRGIRDQLINDGLVPQDEETSTGASADYLKDKIVSALGGTVQSAREIMSWLQETANRLAKAGLPFDWTTPSGSRVREAYHHTTVQKLHTLSGRANLQMENPKSGLIPKKQSLGSAPNYIHSFDAAHLTMTVNEALEAGITDFAMIHDSYGTHACNTSTLGVILRRKFVYIYRTDWLTRLKDEIVEYAPNVKVEDPPKRGDFDITQVMEADYFFS